MPAARDRCYGVGDTSSVEVASRFHGPRYVVGPAAATGLVLHSRDPPATEEKYLGTEVCAGCGVPGPVSLPVSLWDWSHQSGPGDRLRHLRPHHPMLPQLRPPGAHFRSPFRHEKEVLEGPQVQLVEVPHSGCGGCGGQLPHSPGLPLHQPHQHTGI
ncbi:hypothetical protein GBAR_LOCUS26766 [Geodia barretti]|uniref:C2H2-type domain-containing protein n=1 Tax=Geodia barretti TaxID=519541 RepID=A0AA35TID2_GEOBA|nr:hypothetical protein GBAR_LOCUS26766 [Geodia barretti]